MLKNNKGITLIALLITVIVMLILAVVTVSSALNAGIFTRSKTAAAKTQEERDKEVLAAAATAAVDDSGNFTYTALDSNLPEGFTGANGTYTKGGKTYNVNAYGIVTDSNSGGNGGTGTYEIEDEVTIAGVKFNVIGQDSTTVTLFAQDDILEYEGSYYVYLGSQGSGYTYSYDGTSSVIFSSHLQSFKSEIESSWGHSISSIRCITIDEVMDLIHGEGFDGIGCFYWGEYYPTFLKNSIFWVDYLYGNTASTYYCEVYTDRCHFGLVGPNETAQAGTVLRPVIVVNKADL